MRQYLLAQPLVHYDETTYRVLLEEGRTAQSKSYMWVGLAGEKGKSAPIIDEIKQWLDKSIQVMPKTSIVGKGLHYLNNNWSRLIAFLTDG